MKTRIITTLAMLAVLAGCETMQSSRQQRLEAQAREDALRRQQADQVRNVRGAVQTVEAESAQLRRQIGQLRADVNALSGQLGQLNAKMNQLDARQQKEMSALIKQVEAMIRKISAAPRSGGGGAARQGPGREHIVKSGHTLSAIAQAYGSTVKKIKEANNLKSDQIHVGQKLFIPE